MLKTVRAFREFMEENSSAKKNESVELEGIKIYNSGISKMWC